MINYSQQVISLICSNQDPTLPQTVIGVTCEFRAEDTDCAVTATYITSIPLEPATTATFIEWSGLNESQVLAWINSNTQVCFYAQMQLDKYLDSERAARAVTVLSPPWTTSTNTASTVSNQVTSDPIMIETSSDSVVEPTPIVEPTSTDSSVVEPTPVVIDTTYTSTDSSVVEPTSTDSSVVDPQQ